jgi:hypothetical protein
VKARRPEPLENRADPVSQGLDKPERRRLWERVRASLRGEAPPSFWQLSYLQIKQDVTSLMD